MPGGFMILFIFFAFLILQRESLSLVWVDKPQAWWTRVCTEMLATGNLPGLTAPGEGASAVGYFMASVVSFRCRRRKVPEKQEQSYLWAAVHSSGRNSCWRCLFEIWESPPGCPKPIFKWQRCCQKSLMSPDRVELGSLWIWFVAQSIVQ